MRILIVGNYPHQRQHSMLRFASTLFDGLKKCGLNVRFVAPAPVVGRVWVGEVGLGKWLGYIDRLLIFPVMLRFATRWADVVHICDHGNAIYVPLIGKIPHVVTCHDVFGARVARGDVDGMRSRWPGRQLANAMLNGLARAQHVVCVSETTRRGLLRIVPQRSLDNTTVIDNGLNYPYRPLDSKLSGPLLRDLKIPPGPFLLHVGGNQWYKNRLGVLQIFNELRSYRQFKNHRLLLAGKPWTDRMRAFVAHHKLKPWVLERVDVSPERLCALYSTAEALIFPSLEEGFGWPIIEAQACGCPVFTTGRPPMADVGGDGAVYFDPNQPADAARIVSSHWSDRAAIRQRGLINATRFSTERMIGGYVERYKELVGLDSAKAARPVLHG